MGKPTRQVRACKKVFPRYLDIMSRSVAAERRYEEKGRRPTTVVGVRVPNEMLAEIDAACDGVSRSAWVLALIEGRLKRASAAKRGRLP